MQRDMGRPSLAEFLLPEKLGHNERLERIDEAVDWEAVGTGGGWHLCVR